MRLNHRMELRTIQPHERDAVLDLLAEWYEDRSFFARYLEHDPAFRPDLCFVAVDGGRFVSTLQVFRKDIRVRGTTLTVAGVGNVFTTEAAREHGLASQLLRLALERLADSEFDLSALFATRLNFYGGLGWQGHRRFFEYLLPTGAIDAGNNVEIRPFRDDDLPAVMRLYDEINSDRSGTTLRDETYWRGQLRYAGNPAEEFLLARRDDRLLAYARATSLYDLEVLMEHGWLPGEPDALVALIEQLLGRRPGAGLLTQLSHEPEIRQRLESRQIGANRVEDYFWMWRVLAPERVAARLGLTLAEVEAEDFFERLLPPETSVYWLADRF